MRVKKKETLKQIFLGGMMTCFFLIGSLASVGAQVVLKNEATGTLNGVPLLMSNAVVTLHYLSGNAVSLAVAEIQPPSLPTARAGVTLDYFILPTINPGDTGMDQIAITVPSGYTNLAVTAVALGQTAQTLQCASPSAGQYCSTVSGNVLTITLGTQVTTTLTPIKITLTLDTPTTLQQAEFMATVDDTTTPAPPQTVIAGDANGDPSDDNSLAVFVSNAADPTFSAVIAEPTIVLADGISSSTIKTTLRDATQQPLQKKRVSNESDRNSLAKSVGQNAPLLLPDRIVQPMTPTDTNGSTTSYVHSAEPGIALITSTDLTDGITLANKAKVFFTQGMVLKLAKSAHKKTGAVGDIIGYTIEIRNTIGKEVTLVSIEDQLPPPFKYVAGSALFNNQPIPDPTGNTTRLFDIGTVPAFNDQNGNGQADPGEPGYATLQYQLVIGTAAKPGIYHNTAVAKDVCDLCFISNSSEAAVEVTLDPLFDLGTVIGKVFWDNNKNGLHDDGESGLGQVVVALDDGTYAITDENGLYHFPGILPGERLIKIDAHTLPTGASLTTKERQIVPVTPGELAKINFGVTGEHFLTLSFERSGGESSEEASVSEHDRGLEIPQGPTTLREGGIHPSPSPVKDNNGSSTKLFFMALADGEFGHLSTSGNLKMAGTSEYKDFYEEGRIAYYVKGVVQGKYLITSAFDTGKHRANKMFKDLDDNTTRRLLTYIDPDLFYPVYGDDSTVVHDAESQGKFYLAVASDVFQALMGNDALQINDTELASLHRTLYGGQLKYTSLSKTAYGDPKTHIFLFGAQARQAHVENILRGTGGSLYYLSEREVIEGSEQVRIEIRDKDTGLILRQIPQTRDLDYTLKYEEGRILFNLPISGVAPDTGVIHQPGLQGHPVFIVVDFEHNVNSFEKTVSGLRIKQQIGNHWALGGTTLQGEDTEYTLYGGDMTLRWGQGTKVVGEIAGSEGNGMSSRISHNGGLTYTSAPVRGMGKGEAYKIAGRFDLADFNPLFKTGTLEKDRIVAEAYYKSLEPHFVSDGTFLEQGTLKYGGWIQYHLTPQETLAVRSDWQEQTPWGNAGTQRIRFSEIHLTRRNGPLTYTTALQERLLDQATEVMKQDTLAGQIAWSVNKRLSTTLDQQYTLKGPKNWQTTAGATYQLTSSLAALARGMYGHDQDGMLIGVSANMDPHSNVYVHQKWTKTEGQPGLWGNVIGGERKIAEKSRLYTEYERDYGALDQYRRLWGLDQSWSGLKPLQIHFHFEQSDQGPENPRTYNAFGVSTDYDDHPALKFSDRFEIQMEGGKQRQWFTAHQGKFKVDDRLTLFAKFHYSQTGFTAPVRTRFQEGTLGVAYRPILSDRLQGFTKYTSLSDERDDFMNIHIHTSAHIGSTEWLYDMTPRIQWMEKVAVKVSENQSPPHTPTKSQTRLWINRVNYHITPLWDAAAEYRILQQRQANDQHEGFLVEVDRHMGEYTRLGLGYNFSRFSDNLFLENRYDAHGVFIRAQAFF